MTKCLGSKKLGAKWPDTILAEELTTLHKQWLHAMSKFRGNNFNITLVEVPRRNTNATNFVQQVVNGWWHDFTTVTSF